MLRGTNKRGLVRRSFGGFTIVELLTVMSIIIILMSILVPAMSRVRRYAKVVTQKGQFADISKGLELFRNDHQEQYPDSGPTATDSTGGGVQYGYCGAMKLAEALVGQDGMGFNPLSQFTVDGVVMINGEPCDLYPFNLCTQIESFVYTGNNATRPELVSNLQQRIKYVDVENIKSFRLQDMYSWDITTGASFYNNTATFSTAVRPGPQNINGDKNHNSVIGDVFLKADIKSVATACVKRAGQKVGMPVLYFKADTSKLAHDSITQPVANVANLNIYNFDDNYAITMLGCPWETSQPAPVGTGTPHPMHSDPRMFYKEIVNTKITSTPKPHNEDQYILMSAGWDGLYGTKDDVFNFVD